MKKHIVVFGSLLSICLTTLSSLASADTLDTIRQRKKIIVAVDIGTPPFGMIDGQARQSGSDIESAQLLAKDLGVELEVVPVTGANRIPFLLTRKADVVLSSFVITDERKKVIDFSLPYGVLTVGISGPAKPKVASFADLTGKTVAATRGTTADQELVRGIKDFPGVTIVRFEDDATTSTAVATGQQDYIAAPITVIPGIKKANPSRDIELKFVIKEQPYGIGLRKNEPQLKAYLDGWVKTNLKNGKLDGIYKKYFAVSLPADMLN
jgi:polar amino acid transport system substrate-binding protein